MFLLSKSNFIHSLLNRKYNLFFKFVFGFFGWFISFLSTFNYRISNFVFFNILNGNDLKNEVRRLFWLIKIYFLKSFFSLDMMFDFCQGFDMQILNQLENKLNFYLRQNDNIFVKLDLLKILAYQVNSLDGNEKNYFIKINQFKTTFTELKKNLETKDKKEILLNKRVGIYAKKNNNIFKNSEKTLVDLQLFFEEFDLEWFPIAGTLLGFIREGTFLKNDIDIDLGLMADSISFNNLLKALDKTRNFSVSRIEYQKQFFSNFSNIKIPMYLRILHSNGINIDIFLHYLSDEKIYHGTSSLLWVNKAFSLKDYQVKNFNLKVPENSNLYLTETYGDWKTPNIDYNYHRDMLSLTGAKNYLGLEYLLRVKKYCGKKSQKEITNLCKLLF